MVLGLQLKIIGSADVKWTEGIGEKFSDLKQPINFYPNIVYFQAEIP